MAIQCGVCGRALGHIDEACPVCLPHFGQPNPRRNPVADAREGAVKDILAMQVWSERCDDDIVYVNQIRDYLAELERLR